MLHPANLTGRVLMSDTTLISRIPNAGSRRHSTRPEQILQEPGFQRSDTRPVSSNN